MYTKNKDISQFLMESVLLYFKAEKPRDERDGVVC